MNPLTTPTRIAFVGDWHMNPGWAVKAINYAADQGADVILHLGDYGYTFSKQFRTKVDGALIARGIPLLFVDGNHEDFDWLLAKPLDPETGLRPVTEATWHLPRGYRWTWGQSRFLAVGGAHSVDRQWRTAHDSWWPQELLTEEEVEFICAGGQADVIIAHDAFRESPIPGLEKTSHLFPAEEIVASDKHRELLQRVVEATQPESYWHGHYHRYYNVNVYKDWGAIEVTGLNCDGYDLVNNVVVIDLADLPG
jgi:predicted phosphodiesterase